jgi:hypothetical protein
MRHLLFRSLTHTAEQRSVPQACGHWWPQAAAVEGDGCGLRPSLHVLLLNGEPAAVARLERPRALVEGRTHGAWAVDGTHHIDPLCMDPMIDPDGRVLEAMVLFLLAVVWADAPEAPVLLSAGTDPWPPVTAERLARLGGCLEPSGPNASRSWWCFRSAAIRHAPAWPADPWRTVQQLGEQWVRSRTISMLLHVPADPSAACAEPRPCP